MPPSTPARRSVDILDQQLHVLGRVRAGEEASRDPGSLGGCSGSADKHIPEVGREDGIGQLARSTSGRGVQVSKIEGGDDMVDPLTTL